MSLLIPLLLAFCLLLAVTWYSWDSYEARAKKPNMIIEAVRALVEAARKLATGLLAAGAHWKTDDVFRAIAAVESESAREEAVEHALARAVLEAVMREVRGGLRLRENEWSVTETEVDGIVADQLSLLDGMEP